MTPPGVPVLPWPWLLCLPLAIAWVCWQERQGLKRGLPLEGADAEAALVLKLADPARVRVCQVPALPAGLPRWLRRWLVGRGLLPARIGGMALGHAIFVTTASPDPLLVRHELAHVAQYERLGGAGPFLRRYLAEWLAVGYEANPLEAEARALASATAPGLTVAQRLARSESAPRPPAGCPGGGSGS